MINFPSVTFIGLSASTGQNRYAYSALTETCELKGVGSAVRNDLLGYLAGFSKIVSAVNLPSQLNPYLTMYHKPQEQILPFDIMQDVTKKSKVPSWFARNRKLIRVLEQSGFFPFPKADADRQWFSCSAEFSYQLLMGVNLNHSRSIEGRIQRQLFLYNLGLKVPDPMVFFEEITRHRILQGKLNYDAILSQPELDAMILAYLAWLSWTHPDKITLINTTAEEKVVFPSTEPISLHHH